MTDAFSTLRASALPRATADSPWLIEELWTAKAAGLLGGSPKSCKSWLALEMAASIASGTKCLGHFAVKEQGRTLVYLAEDGLHHLRQRLSCLARHRGLELEDLDLHAITAPAMRLDRDDDRARLTQTLQEIRPIFVVLDPLVRLHRLDENSAAEISELLSFIRNLQRRFDCAFLVVHHARKSSFPRSQAGQGLRGSGDLWAFGDTNLYLHRERDHIRLTFEHRSAPAAEPCSLRLIDDDPDRIHLQAVVHQVPAEVKEISKLSDAVLQLLRHSEPMTRVQLRNALRVRNERLGHVLLCLEGACKIQSTPRGWVLGIPWASDPEDGIPDSPL